MSGKPHSIVALPSDCEVSWYVARMDVFLAICIYTNEVSLFQNAPRTCAKIDLGSRLQSPLPIKVQFSEGCAISEEELWMKLERRTA